MIWNVRGGATPLIVPNPVLLTRSPAALYGRFVIVLLPGPAKLAPLLIVVNCVWFNALNASARISNFVRL